MKGLTSRSADLVERKRVLPERPSHVFLLFLSSLEAPLSAKHPLFPPFA